MTRPTTAHTAQEYGELFRKEARELLAGIRVAVDAIVVKNWAETGNLSRTARKLRKIHRFLAPGWDETE